MKNHYEFIDRTKCFKHIVKKSFLKKCSNPEKYSSRTLLLKFRICNFWNSIISLEAQVGEIWKNGHYLYSIDMLNGKRLSEKQVNIIFKKGRKL